jgi:hypothetical protein
VSWLNWSDRRFGKPFTRLTLAEKTQICDDSLSAESQTGISAGRAFFSLMRNPTATAFYTTDEGMKDIGYIGNMALPRGIRCPAVLKPGLA